MALLKTLFERVESVEAKLLDTNFLIKELKASIPPSAEHMEKEIRDVSSNLQKFKIDIAASIGHLNEQIIKANDTKNLSALEDKMVARQNDCVKALAKKLADRDEVQRKFRVFSNSIKNMFDLLKFVFVEDDETMVELKNLVTTEMENNSSLNDIM
jgi:hypothetical protein